MVDDFKDVTGRLDTALAITLFTGLALTMTNIGQFLDSMHV